MKHRRPVSHPSLTPTPLAACVALALLAGACSGEPAGDVDVALDGTAGVDATIDQDGSAESDGSDDADSDTTDPGDAAVDALPDGPEDTGLPDSEPDVVPDTEEEVGPSVALSCVDQSVTTPITTTGGGELEIPIEGSVTGGVTVRFLGREVTSDVEVTLACGGESIVPDGAIPISPAFDITSAGQTRFLRRYFVSMPFERGTLPDGALASSIRIYHRPAGRDAVVEPLVANLQENMIRGTVRFESELTGTFQLGVREEAGTPVDRRWNFRAVTGVSMGGIGSSMIGSRNPDEFDFVGPLGGPGEWTYLAHYIREGGMGGFRPAPTFGRAEMFTPMQEAEHPMAYDDWYFPTGEGTGGSFNRNDYSEIFLDLSLALGNMVTYSLDSPFLAPGLPFEEVERPARERCPRSRTCPPEGTFTIAEGYFDDEYNPDGSLPVISFCDGQGSRDRDIPFGRACDIDFNGQPDEANEGLYDRPCDQHRPMDITLAVDVNGNGMRDSGEPVVRNFFEPYDDVGADGTPSTDEEGYDPVSNPDPAGDDYDFVANVFGTEGNWLWEEGEPYRDDGLDGVPGTPQLADGGYDFGEGNDRFDYNPNLLRVYEEYSPRLRYLAMTEEQRRTTNFYIDSGIRDLFNFSVAGNQFAGTIQATGQNVRLYEDFHRVQDLPDDEADEFNFTLVDYESLGDNIYVRYGSIDASDEDVCFGDGKHVGTIPQLANRLLTMLGFITNRFPDGDRHVIETPFPLPSGSFSTVSPTTGDRIKYSIAFPPGYEWTACTDGRDNDGDGLRDGDDRDCTSANVLSESGEAGLTYCTDGIDNDADGAADGEDGDCLDGDGNSEWAMDSPFRNGRFPVVYIMHGYGQTPDELQIAALPFSGFMANGDWPKVILVFPDGFCGETLVTACSDGVDNDDDGDVDTDDGDCGGPRGMSESGESVGVCDDGVDNDLDGFADDADGGCLTDSWHTEGNCLQGNFYIDHVSFRDGRPGGPPYEQLFFDLIEHVDETYRTRDPEVFPDVR